MRGRDETPQPNAAGTPPAAAAGVGPHDRCALRVLVATASENLGRLICRSLGRSGYDPEPVDSAAAAIEATRRSRYEAIVTDMHLPDGCGATLLSHLRAAGVDIPAILLAEQETPRLRRLADAIPGTRCLTALDPTQLRVALSAALASRDGTPPTDPPAPE